MDMKFTHALCLALSRAGIFLHCVAKKSARGTSTTDSGTLSVGAMKQKNRMAFFLKFVHPGGPTAL